MVCLLKNRKMLRRNAGEVGMLRRCATTLDWVYRTQRCAPLRDGVAARRGLRLGGLLLGATLRSWDETTRPAREGGHAAARRQNLCCASRPTANFGGRGRLIREKIIGH